MSDSRYGHDDISCMTYDHSCRHFTWMCVFSMQPLHVHLGGE